MSERPIRVLVVDDSAFMRRALSRLIGSGRGIEVIGTASNGEEALIRVAELQPDVVTMDLEMPQMDGLQALEALMARRPVPVIMFSSLTQRGADITMRCLELGAFDFICKQSGSVDEDLTGIRYLIWQKVREAARSHPQQAIAAVSRIGKGRPAAIHGARARRVVVIGASTGGPRALLDVLTGLPSSLPAGVLVVQHMPPTFTAAMARRFNDNCALAVREAEEGDLLEDGLALVAFGGRHLELLPDGRVHLADDPPLWGVRPAIDVTMTGGARIFGPAMLGVILTGMGRDGTEGLACLKRHGGATIAQDEATSVVYGMPRSATEAGVVDRVLPLPEIADAICAWCQSVTPIKFEEGKRDDTTRAG